MYSPWGRKESDTTKWLSLLDIKTVLRSYFGVIKVILRYHFRREISFKRYKNICNSRNDLYLMKMTFNICYFSYVRTISTLRISTLLSLHDICSHFTILNYLVQNLL